MDNKLANSALDPPALQARVRIAWNPRARSYKPESLPGFVCPELPIYCLSRPPGHPAPWKMLGKTRKQIWANRDSKSPSSEPCCCHTSKKKGFSFSLSSPPPSFISPSVTSRTWICSSAARRTSAWGDKMLLRFSIKASLRPLLTSAPAMFPRGHARVPATRTTATPGSLRSPALGQGAFEGGRPRIYILGDETVWGAGEAGARKVFNSDEFASGQWVILAGNRASLNLP